ncbi:restriction endonuclease subunit S [Alcanivorax sp. NBRC 102028]|uniref:restriction endonuclease subunit S n=1 Tax=Alcanivorax sp. NBRC 102028 TaxID=1113897 RepID=UPI000789E12D|nr:restriction endonuclease subunit S [Alcanivorax sp. NBRC 102028]
MRKVVLSELCSIQSGGTPSRGNEAYWAGSIPWAKISDLEAAGDGYIKDTEEHITEEGLKAIRGRLFDNGTLLFAMYGSVGKTAIVKGEVSTNQAILGIKPITKQLDLGYLRYWLRSQQYIFDRDAKGVTQKNLSAGYVRGLKIPLPPLSEQKRIATILDKANAIRRKRQQATQLAEEFLRAVFLDMFGDPVTNPKGWEIAKLSDVGTLDRGKSKHRPRNDPALLGGDYPLIQTGDVANSKGYIKKYKSTYSELGLEQSRLWPAGTLCITIAANIAKTGVLTFDACFPDSVVGFTPNHKATVEYVQHWLGFLQKTLEASAPESAQKNINLAILRNLDIPLPEIEKQRAFSELVERTIRLLEKSTVFISDNEYLFLSSSQKAFSGSL